MRISVFGMGYVGCVTAVCLADAGHDVTGVDISVDKVSQLNDGVSPIVEPGLAELIRARVASGHFVATCDQEEAVRSATMLLVAVGTPTAEDGGADLTFLDRLCETIGRVLAVSGPHDTKTIMVRSTIPPGTIVSRVIPALERASGRVHGEGFTVLFCPEFLREATAIADFQNPPFTVVGALEPEHAAPALELFAFLAAPMRVVDIPTAECVKYACNAFHAVKVAFGNEMARLFEAGGADPRTVMDLFVQDRDLNISPKYFRPGFAYGGSCLPKDLRALAHLAETHHVAAPLIEGVSRSNDAHIAAAFHKIVNSGAQHVAQFGMTFKSGTDDLRESPYVTLVEHLLAAGLEVSIYDPTVQVERLTGSNFDAIRARIPNLAELLCGSPREALKNADCASLGSAHADVYDAILEFPDIRVVDLTGALPGSVEAHLRDQQSTDGTALYQGVAW